MAKSPGPVNTVSNNTSAQTEGDLERLAARERMGRPPNLRQADEFELYRYRKAGVSIKACASFFRVSVPTSNRIIAKFKAYDERIDRTAQQLWHEVAASSDTIGDLISKIPASGVQGEETRNELRKAQALLAQAAALLERTAARFENWADPKEVAP